MTLEVDPGDSHEDSHACVAGLCGRQRVEDGTCPVRSGHLADSLCSVSGMREHAVQRRPE